MESFSGKPFPQRQMEIETLLMLARGHRCRSFLEIGSRWGDSFHYLASGLGTGSVAVSVDMPGGKWGDEKSKPSLLAAVKALRGKARGVNASALFGDSRDPQMIAEVKARGPYDLVFIDGDHRLEGVTADWQNYGPMASKLVAFHDIDADAKPAKKARKYGVPQLWREIKKTHCTIEIVSSNREMGIGVVVVA